MHDEDYSRGGDEGGCGGSSLSAWLLVSGGIYLSLGARVTAKPLHVLLLRQLADWLIRGIFSLIGSS